MLFRALTFVFWSSVALLAAWLVFNAFAPGLVGALPGGEPGASLVQAVLFGVVAACSGALAWLEFRGDPVEEGEYGGWTMRSLFYAVVFALSFFVFPRPLELVLRALRRAAG